MFLRFFDEGLAQSSFLLACPRTRQAVVIDPRRDIAVYVDAARQHGLTLRTAIETHVHADFVSGARELAELGARVIAGPGAGLKYPGDEVADGERVAIGDVSLTFLHTPGHTPEHIAILAGPVGEPVRLFTGDLLFVGAVGRPDLLGEQEASPLARQLHASLARVMALPDDVEVHPGHGAGSLCGAGIGNEPYSTIARERRHNPLLQYDNEDAFVAAVLGDLPETPPYFARMKRINQEGPPVLGLAHGIPDVPPITPGAAAALVADGALLLDLRDAESFAAAHPAGALNIGHGSKVGYWAGWVIPADTPVILLADRPALAAEAAVQLLRVGIDRIEGAVAGGFPAWRGAGLPTAAIPQISARDLHDALRHGHGQAIVDVRTASEWRRDHLDGTMNIPVGDLPARAAELPREGRIAVLCEGGYRSSLGASLLEREGIEAVNVTGGMAALRALEVA